MGTPVSYTHLDVYKRQVYYKVGKSYYQHKEYQLAKNQFEKALTKGITTVPNKLEIEKYLNKIKRKLQ